MKKLLWLYPMGLGLLLILGGYGLVLGVDLNRLPSTKLMETIFCFGTMVWYLTGIYFIILVLTNQSSQARRFRWVLPPLCVAQALHWYIVLVYHIYNIPIQMEQVTWGQADTQSLFGIILAGTYAFHKAKPR